MSIKIVKFSFKNKELFSEAEKIRTKVFIKEQKTTLEEEFDGLDNAATHFIIYFNNKPAGTSRVRVTEEGIKIERFAVYKSLRGKQIGAQLLDFIMKDSILLKKKIYLYAQIHAEPFYEKHRFKRVGNKFVEANIEHYKMVYTG